MSGPLVWLGRHLHRLERILIPRLRAVFIRAFLGVDVRRVGKNVKFRGLEFLDIGGNFSLGDFCWIEAVTHYAGQRYSPRLRIGCNVSISDSTHISCLEEIVIGDGCLFGSKVYIGDHSHGRTRDLSPEDLSMAPVDRVLDDARPIHIGAACWLGDGVVILAGTKLAAGSIVGANSVVRLQCERPALVVGMPARVVRFLD